MMIRADDHVPTIVRRRTRWHKLGVTNSPLGAVAYGAVADADF